jgi:tRNA (cmo5U34)-methyltransferase
MAVFDFDSDPEIAKNYDQGPRTFVPGYEVFQGLAAVIFAQRLKPDARILVVGAGGGKEVVTLGRMQPAWRFCGVDPSANMLEAGAARVAEMQAPPSVDWVKGEVSAVAEGNFDAATSFLSSNFIADDGAKLDFFRQIKKRLKPGGLFAFVEGCADKSAPDWNDKIDLYAANARRNGATEDMLRGAVNMQQGLHYISAERAIALLLDAGFSAIEEFYSALWIKGWTARA